jgi:16S rRNA (adenine1518-N6/adenine1519-N6)-dimethyltransferase
VYLKSKNAFRVKKYLGQVFLLDKNVQEKIIQNCRLTSNDTVLEIGAGRGELTLHIARHVRRLVAIEKDRTLYTILTKKLSDYKNTELLNADILKFDIKEYFINGENLKIIGNIPYNITTLIVQHLFKYLDKIDSMYFTLQKEFSQRLIATPGTKNYGAMSCFVQYYTKPEQLLLIKKGSFWPIPKVDSCFVKMTTRDRPAVEVKDEKLFFKIIRSSFNKRRKILKNSLQGVVGPEKLESYFKRYKIDPRIRPEALSLKDFSNLCDL